jgi:hypothetical protein
MQDRHLPEQQKTNNMGLYIEVASRDRQCHSGIAKKCTGRIKSGEKCLTFRGHRVTENCCKRCMTELTRKL